MIKDHLNLLGLEAIDPVTGMKGVITSISFDLSGCIQAALTPPANKEGVYQQSIWIDIQRLKITGKKAVCKVSDFTRETGCAQKPSK